jgi:hypothetical protein
MTRAVTFFFTPAARGPRAESDVMMPNAERSARDPARLAVGQRGNIRARQLAAIQDRLQDLRRFPRQLAGTHFFFGP